VALSLTHPLAVFAPIISITMNHRRSPDDFTLCKSGLLEHGPIPLGNDPLPKLLPSVA